MTVEGVLFFNQLKFFTFCVLSVVVHELCQPPLVFLNPQGFCFSLAINNKTHF